MNSAGVDYTTAELLYLPRNPRPNRMYGYGPVEQIVMSVNIALRRQASQLAYFTEGNTPEALVGVPPEWTPDQIGQFQQYWDSLLAGDLGQRRHTRFVPGGLEYHPTREVTLKDQFDEWLARVVCFAFSVSPSAFITQVNRATAQTAQQTADAEGLQPLKLWVKSLVDRLIEEDFGWGDLEFGWAEESAPDPATLMTINTGYVAAGIKTVDEARAEIGLGPVAGGEKPTPMPQLMQRGYDPNEPRDENGRWTTGGGTTADATSTVSVSATDSYADETSDNDLDVETSSLGKRPPTPPGYDPNTWTQGGWSNGLQTLFDPDKQITYTEHREDASHWRHWDAQNENGKSLGRVPENSVKFKDGDKSNRPGRSATDPSGDAPEWASQSLTPNNMTTIPDEALTAKVPTMPEDPIAPIEILP